MLLKQAFVPWHISMDAFHLENEEFHAVHLPVFVLFLTMDSNKNTPLSHFTLPHFLLPQLIGAKGCNNSTHSPLLPLVSCGCLALPNGGFFSATAIRQLFHKVLYIARKRVLAVERHYKIGLLLMQKSIC